MNGLINQNDKYKMNWVEGNTEWGTVRVPDGIKFSVKSEMKNDTVIETYVFTNTSDKDIFTSLRDISIYTPFNDDYPDAKTCMTNRCHTHIWCGDNISYVMALRMGGEAPHLGLVLTEGSLGGYSVERDIKRGSNDRGDFILHPSPVHIAPNESYTISWTLFWHNGITDFYNKIKQYNTRYIDIKAENYVVFENEKINISVTPTFNFSVKDIVITDNGKPVDYSLENRVINISESAKVGEHNFQISVHGIKTHCNILTLPVLDTLAEKRCRFIAEKQQFKSHNSKLDGAYLTYDNDEKHIFYSRENDFNGGRERVGMGVLIAKYLQTHEDKMLSDSLNEYVKYIERELFDKETGVVYNDCGRDNKWNRLYNYSWISVLYVELYKLYGNKEMLMYAYRAMISYYTQGGTKFYAIEIPVYDIISCLEKENMTEEKERLIQFFKEHCEALINNGLNYPTSEVNYEQSIVAPAAFILMQMYRVTKEQKYIDGAKEQMKALELFNGLQPDYHLYEVAIRHWDGYWFGKRRMYGDTFPHYWSALTANVYAEYAYAENDMEYKRKADAAYRGVMSLFMSDGSASAAYVYPVSVNGNKAEFYDPYANDQDWGMYYMMKSIRY
jgi:hypothetical protein